MAPPSVRNSIGPREYQNENHRSFLHARSRAGRRGACSHCSRRRGPRWLWWPWRLWWRRLGWPWGYGGGYSGGSRGGHGDYFGGYGYGHQSAWYGGYGYGYGHGWGGYGLGIGAAGYYWDGYVSYAPDYYYYGAVPAGAAAVPQAGPPVPQVSPAPDPIFYPKNGQSAAIAESDQRECNRWATTQRGAMTDASIFQRATFACMESRGYTVR